MLKLRNSEPIARGGHRTVYVHPDDPKLCVKVLHQPWQQINRRLNDPFRSVRPRRHYDENRSELHELLKLKRKLGIDLTDHFPEPHGLIDTDFGEGLVVQRILDHHGQTSLTLKQHLWLYGFDGPCRQAVDDFWRFLLARRIMVRDPQPRNLIVQHRRNEPGLRIIMIDGFGSSDLLPIRSWFSGLTARKLATRRRRTERGIARELEHKRVGRSPSEQGMIKRDDSEWPAEP